MNINAELRISENKEDLLAFVFGESDELAVNLNSDNSVQELKMVFIRLLGILASEEVSIVFVKAHDYNNAMYAEVCEAYVNELNKEIKRAREEMVSENLVNINEKGSAD